MNHYRSLLKAAVIFVPLLGTTWVFGILAVNENTTVFAWIFTVLNSLQVSAIKHISYANIGILIGSTHLNSLCVKK